MSKVLENNQVTKKEAEKIVKEDSFQGKTVEEMKEIVHILQAQKNDHITRANNAKQAFEKEMNLVTKAQGALEVMLQMIPKEEVEKMIAEESEKNES